MIITYKGISYNINKQQFEPDDIFYERMWFVAKQQPKSDKEMKEAIYYSKIWSNIKFLNCEYNSDILHKINKIQKQFIS